MTTPKQKDGRKARKQAVEALNTAVEQVRTPLLAAIGAGDLATQAVVEAVNKARSRATERVEATRHAVEDLPSDLTSRRSRRPSTSSRRPSRPCRSGSATWPATPASWPRTCWPR